MSRLKYMIVDELPLCVPRKTICEQLAFDESLDNAMKLFRKVPNDIYRVTQREMPSSFIVPRDQMMQTSPWIGLIPESMR